MSDGLLDNRYRVLKKIGAGAMGEVLQVIDLSKDKTLALKILSTEQTNSEAVQRFKREFSLLARLKHPNLCMVYDFGSLRDRRGYFTMEYIGGQDIITATANLKYEQIYPWIVQLCRVLQYIHAKGLIHYDIKPSNVLVQLAGADGEGGLVKLMDFGLAAEACVEDGMVIKGSIPYIAPEIFQGLIVDHRADLYSLGVLMYEIFSRRGFPSKYLGDFNALYKLGASWRPAVIERFPKRLGQLIMKLISYESAQRYNHANDVIQEISRISSARYALETEQTMDGYLMSSKFVGRDREIKILRSSYEEARRGICRMVMITGDTGIGKTRLMKEFKIGIQLLQGHCLIGNALRDVTRPLEPFYDIFKEILNSLRVNHPHEVKVARAILSRMFPDLARGMKKDIPQSSAVDPKHERLKNFEAMTRLIRSISSELGGLAILLEDLHWADELSCEYLGYLVENPGDQNIFIGGSARSSELQDNPALRKLLKNLEDNGRLIRIELPPLNFRDVSAFLDSAITPESNSPDLVRYLMKKTGGNPFFVEEIMRTILRKKGMSIGRRMAELKNIPIPETIEDLVMKRFKDLDRDSQLVIKYGSVMIRDFNYDMMRYLTGLEEGELTRILWGLKSKQLLVEHGDRYHFYHPTLREVINKRLDPEERRDLNNRVGRFLEISNRGHLDGVINDLAFYFINARHREKGLRYGMRAALGSMDKYANEQAIRFYRGLVDLLDAGEIRRRFHILQMMAQIEVISGYYEDAIKDYNRALGLGCASREERADVYRRIGDLFRKIPRYRQALVYYKKGLDILPRKNRRGHAAFIHGAIHAGIGFAHLGMGDSERANRANRQALRLLKGIKGREVNMLQNDIYYNIGVIHANNGEYHEAFLNFRKAYRSNERIGNEMGRALLLFAFGYGYYLMGDFKKAARYYRRSMSLSDKIGNPRGVLRAQIQLGCIFYAQGNYQKALEYFQKANRVSTHTGNKREIALSLQGIGNCFESQGDFKIAERNYDRAFKLWNELRIKDNEALTLLDLGRISQAVGDYTTALRFYRRSLRIFRAIKRPYETALARLRLAALLFDIGQLTKATRILRDVLRLTRSLCFKEIEVHCYHILGWIELILGRYSVAQALCRQGTRLARSTNLRRPQCQFSVLLANIYFKEGRYAKGIKAGEKALAYAQAMNIRDPMLESYLVLYRCRCQMGSDSRIKILGQLDELRSMSEQYNYPEILWRVNYEYGRFLQGERQPRRATKYYRRCLDIFRCLIGQLRQETFRQSYLGRPDRKGILTQLARFKIS